MIRSTVARLQSSRISKSQNIRVPPLSTRNSENKVTAPLFIGDLDSFDLVSTYCPYRCSPNGNLWLVRMWLLWIRWTNSLDLKMVRLRKSIFDMCQQKIVWQNQPRPRTNTPFNRSYTSLALRVGASVVDLYFSLSCHILGFGRAMEDGCLSGHGYVTYMKIIGHDPLS